MNKDNKFVITINRELGSGGRTIGRILAEKLGVPFYDKALIKALEAKYQLNTDEIERLEVDIAFVQCHGMEQGGTGLQGTAADGGVIHTAQHCEGAVGVVVDE